MKKSSKIIIVILLVITILGINTVRSGLARRENIRSESGTMLAQRSRSTSPETRTEVPVETKNAEEDKGKAESETSRRIDRLMYILAFWSAASAAWVIYMRITYKSDVWDIRLLCFKTDITGTEKLLLGVLVFATLLAIWGCLTYTGAIQPRFLPFPESVLGKLYELLRRSERLSRDLYRDIGYSAFRIFAGFLLAAIIAVPLGVLMGCFRRIHAFVNPLSAFIRFMPATAFISLLIVWFGIGERPKIYLVFLGIFFFLLQMITDTVANVPTKFLETAYTLGANRLQVLFRVIWFAALPGIMDSLKTMVGAAWTYLIVAEMLASNEGLGNMIRVAERVQNTPMIFSGILIIGIIGLLTNLIFEFAIEALFPWRKYT